MKAEEGDIGSVPRPVVVDKLTLVGEQLKEMKAVHYSLMVGLQQTRKKLERVEGQIKKKGALIQSKLEGARSEKLAGWA